MTFENEVHSGFIISAELHTLLSLVAWWCHQMETFYALLAICAGNSPVRGEFPTQRPVTRIFGVFFELRLNKGLNKQSWGWKFDTLSRPLWHQCNGRFTELSVSRVSPSISGSLRYQLPGTIYPLSIQTLLCISPSWFNDASYIDRFPWKPGKHISRARYSMLVG